MQDLKLIKTNKNEQCEKIFFRIVHFCSFAYCFFTDKLMFIT
jgi:hypothetical protein